MMSHQPGASIANGGVELIAPERERQANRAVVSVICTAYNHEGYIAKALDGFLMQETSFPVEIIVHDDASTDGTADIIREYDRRYPRRLRCVLQTENQCSRIGAGIFHDIAFPLASGEFIALCEGDDYWTDPAKLEKQVGFMRQFPKLSMSFHAARVVYVDKARKDRIHAYKGGRFVKEEHVVYHGGGLYPTCSSMFRRDVFENYPRFFLAAPVADSMWILNAITKGGVGYIEEVMAVYNCRVPGSWSHKRALQTQGHKLEYFSKLEEVRAEFDRYTEGRYSKWIRMRASRNRRLVLLGGSGGWGGYDQYRRMRRAMLVRDRIRFHFQYPFYCLWAWVRRKFHSAEANT